MNKTIRPTRQSSSSNAQNTEQKHIADALVFELSKVERPDIRMRIVSHLLNIDEDLAGRVANGLGASLPSPAQAARPTRMDLDPSPALSIVANGPQALAGRKLGILVTDGTDAGLFTALIDAVTAAGAVYEVVAPKIGGVTLSEGSMLAAKHKVDGGASVLFDAVAILASAEGGELLSHDKPSLDFISDAFAHCKFIGLSEGALSLAAGAGLQDKLTPVEGLDIIDRDLTRVYTEMGHPQRWKMLRYDVGHLETPEGRQEIIAFLQKSL